MGLQPLLRRIRLAQATVFQLKAQFKATIMTHLISLARTAQLFLEHASSRTEDDVEVPKPLLGF